MKGLQVRAQVECCVCSDRWVGEMSNGFGAIDSTFAATCSKPVAQGYKHR